MAEGISGVRLRERWDLLDFCAMGDGREAEKNTVPEWRAGDSKIGDVVDADELGSRSYASESEGIE